MIPSYNHLLPSADFKKLMAADKEGQKDIKMIEQIQKSQTQSGRNKQNEDEIRDMLKENNIKNAIVL